MSNGRSPSHKHHKVQTESDSRYEIRLSGSGGQGLIFAGVVLAQAIATIDGRNAVQTQSYGPEARGGASRADLVIADGDIYYPKPMKLDLLLALTQEACDSYYPDLKEDGLLIIDNQLVTQVPTSNYIGFPFVQLAKTEIGVPMVANVIALGAICSVSGIVSVKALTEVVRLRAPRGTDEKNLAALDLGLKLGKKARKEAMA
ncbi:MAG: 2-oxoacid:acceptor oxidoreductase family protein [candidate division Zixibacteria bacterium]|nr:2-oxoacid:acceptor oxidoreductase family protein [candidate division Zixibacteria bacterium]